MFYWPDGAAETKTFHPAKRVNKFYLETVVVFYPPNLSAV